MSRGLAAVVSVLVLGVGAALTACGVFAQPPPDTAARDAYKATKLACAVYELAPGSKHTPTADRTCRSLRLVCNAPDDNGAGGAP